MDRSSLTGAYSRCVKSNLAWKRLQTHKLIACARSLAFICRACDVTRAKSRHLRRNGAVHSCRRKARAELQSACSLSVHCITRACLKAAPFQCQLGSGSRAPRAPAAADNSFFECQGCGEAEGFAQDLRCPAEEPPRWLSAAGGRGRGFSSPQTRSYVAECKNAIYYTVLWVRDAGPWCVFAWTFGEPRNSRVIRNSRGTQLYSYIHRVMVHLNPPIRCKT